MKKERLVALFGGGDWTDASVAHLIVPKNIGLEKEHKKHCEWYTAEYCGTKNIKYISFEEWLINLGAKKAGEDNIEEFWET